MLAWRLCLDLAAKAVQPLPTAFAVQAGLSAGYQELRWAEESDPTVLWMIVVASLSEITTATQKRVASSQRWEMIHSL